MSALRQQLKRLTPRPLWLAARELWLAARRLAAWPGTTFHPRRRRSIAQLAAYKDKHLGQRAFILGNGPSLARTDVSRLANEITFGMNRVYLAFEEWGLASTYFLTVNDLIIEQAGVDIAQLPMPKFLSWRGQALMLDAPQTMFLHTTYEGPTFAKDARGRLWEGATVTYVALQLAYYMGCDPVILIGVDHSFSSQGAPNTTVVSQGDDPDHFDARYFGKGFRWQLPDLETSERAYALAREAFEADGRRVLDATIGGELTVFPKVDYDSLF